MPGNKSPSCLFFWFCVFPHCPFSSFTPRAGKAQERSAHHPLCPGLTVQGAEAFANGYTEERKRTNNQKTPLTLFKESCDTIVLELELKPWGLLPAGVNSFPYPFTFKGTTRHRLHSSCTSSARSFQRDGSFWFSVCLWSHVCVSCTIPCSARRPGPGGQLVCSQTRHRPRLEMAP